MRILLFLSFILYFVSCKEAKTDKHLYQKDINEVIGEIFHSSCLHDKNNYSQSEYFIALSDSIFELNYNFKNFKFQNFNLDSFINRSTNIEYDIANIPKEDNLNILVVNSDKIRNSENLQFSQTVNFKYMSEYGEKYCKSLLLNKPRIIKHDEFKYQILVSAVSYFEHPLQYSFYLINGNDKSYSFRKLKITDQKLILY